MNMPRLLLCFFLLLLFCAALLTACARGPAGGEISKLSCSVQPDGRLYYTGSFQGKPFRLVRSFGRKGTGTWVMYSGPLTDRVRATFVDGQGLTEILAMDSGHRLTLTRAGKQRLEYRFYLPDRSFLAGVVLYRDKDKWLQGVLKAEAFTGYEALADVSDFTTKTALRATAVSQLVGRLSLISPVTPAFAAPEAPPPPRPREVEEIDHDVTRIHEDIMQPATSDLAFWSVPFQHIANAEIVRQLGVCEGRIKLVCTGSVRVLNAMSEVTQSIASAWGRLRDLANCPQHPATPEDRAELAQVERSPDPEQPAQAAAIEAKSDDRPEAGGAQGLLASLRDKVSQLGSNLGNLFGHKENGTGPAPAVGASDKADEAKLAQAGDEILQRDAERHGVSKEKTAALSAPANLTATQTGEFKWKLTWSPVPGASGYNIYQQTKSPPSVKEGIFVEHDLDEVTPFLSVKGGEVTAMAHQVNAPGTYYWVVAAKKYEQFNVAYRLSPPTKPAKLTFVAKKTERPAEPKRNEASQSSDVCIETIKGCLGAPPPPDATSSKPVAPPKGGYLGLGDVPLSGDSKAMMEWRKKNGQ